MKQKLLLHSFTLRAAMLVALLTTAISGAWADTTFKRITSTSDLVVGDRYIVVSETNKVAMGTLKSSKGQGISVTISSNSITIDESTSGVDVFTLSGSQDEYMLRGSKSTAYLGWDSNTNFATIGSKPSDASTLKKYQWKISFNGNNASIANVSSTDRFIRGYNSNKDFRAYTTSNGSAVQLYKEVASKSPIGSFSTIPEQVIPYNDMTEFNPADYFEKATGATGDVTFTVTPTSGTIYYEDGYLVAEDYGTQEMTITATPATADAGSFEEVTQKFTASCADSRTAIGTISAISPTTVYVGAIDDFVLTKDFEDSAIDSWAWESSDASKLTLADETYEALAEGTVNVTVTATPTSDTYKPATATFPVAVEYKYSAPTISKDSGEGLNFSSSTNVTLEATDGTTVYYTTNGDDPTKGSTAYATPFAITATTTIKAIAIDADGLISPIATATYTKAAVTHTDITLTAGQTLSFTDFSGLGTAYASAPASPDFTASDGDKYTWSQVNCISSGTKLQMRKQSGVTLTSGTITTPNGFTLNLTYTGGAPSVKAGETAQTASSSDSESLTYNITSNSTIIVITANTSTQTYLTGITLTANKAVNVITATTARTIDRTLDETSVTLDATSTSGAVTYTLKSSSLNSEDYSFNAETGVLTVTGTQSGTITITASSAATSTYEAAEDVDIVVTVVGAKADSTIVVSDATSTYGTHYTLDISDFASGEVTLESSNTNVATVSGLTITPVAVGTTTITVTTAESALYKAGSDTFEFTVTAPAGSTTAGKSTTTSTATLDFTDNTKWNFPTANTVDEHTYNDGTYEIKLKGTTGNGYSFKTTDKYLILGKNGATLTFQAFDKFVTQIDIKGRTGASGKVTQNIYVSETAVSTETTGATSTNSYAIAEEYQAPGNIYTLKLTSGDNTQITSITLHFTDAASESVTLNANGYATYCSVNPLDFSDDSEVSAWAVKSVEDNTITFTQIKEAVKGGTGVLLKGEGEKAGQAGEVTLTSVDSDKTLSENLLEGTLAPTYVEADEYYGLSGQNFVKVNAGTVKAGKALLPADHVGEVNAFRFVFEAADGIRTVETVSAEEAARIFDLNGRQLQKTQRGINIVNGKKVVVR